MELGGFAENESIIDGDFNAFNYCLAEEYMTAIVTENFEMLGEMSNDLLDKIIYWLNYDGEKDDLNARSGISDGSIITIKNRSFIEAIIACHKYQLAETYILRGSCNPKLYLICLLSGEEEYRGILNNIHFHTYNKEDYIMFLYDLFKEIELEFTKIKETDEKKLFLTKIKQGISNIRYPKEYGEITISISDYNWGKQLKKNR